MGILNVLLADDSLRPDIPLPECLIASGLVPAVVSKAPPTPIICAATPSLEDYFGILLMAVLAKLVDSSALIGFGGWN